MKKKLLTLAAVAVITVSSAVPTFASTVRSSPANVTITPTPTSVATPTPRTPGRSPKTGNIDYVLYGSLSAAAFASIAVISKRKKDDAEF